MTTLKGRISQSSTESEEWCSFSCNTEVYQQDLNSHHPKAEGPLESKQVKESL